MNCLAILAGIPYAGGRVSAIPKLEANVATGEIGTRWAVFGCGGTDLLPDRGTMNIRDHGSWCRQ